jgi:hypothetical protein
MYDLDLNLTGIVTSFLQPDEIFDLRCVSAKNHF